MLSWISLGLLVFGATASQGVERPDWVAQAKKADDPVYRYYIGRGVSATETEAVEDATRDAQVQAIRENFGSETQIELRALEDASASALHKSVDEVFPRIRLDGFEQADIHVEAGPKTTQAWLLFRFAKVAIAREKIRLSQTPNSLPAPDWSEEGSVKQARQNGTLEVSSEPPGAEVYIDGKRFGVTPVRLLGSVESGSHELTLDHPQFRLHRQRVSLSAGRTERVFKKLKKALGYLSITTTPSGARLKVEGHPAGTSPLKLFPVSAGKRVPVQIRERNSGALDTEVFVERDRHVVRHYDLETPSTRSDEPPRRLDPAIQRFLGQSDEPPSSSEPTPPSERSIYLLSLVPIAYASSPIKEVDTPAASFGADFAVELTQQWFLSVGYRLGQREVQYSDALVSAKLHQLSVALGWQVGFARDHTVSFSAVALRLIQNYQLQYTSDLTFRTSPALLQWGWGGALGYRWDLSSIGSEGFGRGWGLGARLLGASLSSPGSGLTAGAFAEGEILCFIHF